MHTCQAIKCCLHITRNLQMLLYLWPSKDFFIIYKDIHSYNMELIVTLCINMHKIQGINNDKDIHFVGAYLCKSSLLAKWIKYLWPFSLTDEFVTRFFPGPKNHAERRSSVTGSDEFATIVQCITQYIYFIVPHYIPIDTLFHQGKRFVCSSKFWLIKKSTAK